MNGNNSEKAESANGTNQNGENCALEQKWGETHEPPHKMSTEKPPYSLTEDHIILRRVVYALCIFIGMSLVAIFALSCLGIQDQETFKSTVLISLGALASLISVNRR